MTLKEQATKEKQVNQSSLKKKKPNTLHVKGHLQEGEKTTHRLGENKGFVARIYK